MSSIRKLLSPGKGSRSSTPEPESAASQTPRAPSTPPAKPAVVSVQTGTAPIGSAVQSPEPSSAPIVDKHGAPITVTDDSMRREVSATISSPGLSDLGPEGEKSRRAAEANSLGRSGPTEGDVAIAPAQGIAPEAIMTARKSTGKGLTARFRAGSIGSVENGTDAKSLTQQALGALSSIAPSNVLGVSLNSLGADSSSPPAPAADVKEAQGTSRPQLEAPTTPTVDRQKIDQLEIASAEEQKRFHQRLPSVPKDDALVKSWSCALQREILIHGRLYLSKHTLSFRAKLFSFETTVILPLTEIVSLEKRMTALVIPNGLEVSTRTSRHSFASILNRDMVFKQIVSVWQLSHPEYTDDGDSVFDKHLAGDREHDVASVAPAESVRSVETADTAGKKKRKLKVPSLHHLGIAKKQRDHGDHEGEDDDDEGGGSHEVTHCSCEDKHFKEEVLDATFATTPEKMHKLMFDSAFLTKFWAEDEGLTEVHTDAWEPSLSDNDGTRSYDYIKPLNASMGPKTAKCELEDSNDYYDAEKAISTLTTTRTPDVPSGHSFCIRTRTCLTFAKTGGCRVVVTTEVDWSKVNRFLRGVIEKSSIEGQRAYHQDLAKAARAFIKQNAAEYSAGISDSPEEDNADQAAPSSGGGLLDSVTSSLPPISPLVALLVVLALTNFVTVFLLRRARHEPVATLLSDTAARMADLEARMARLRKATSSLL